MNGLQLPIAPEPATVPGDTTPDVAVDSNHFARLVAAVDRFSNFNSIAFIAPLPSVAPAGASEHPEYRARLVAGVDWDSERELAIAIAPTVPGDSVAGAPIDSDDFDIGSPMPIVRKKWL